MADNGRKAVAMARFLAIAHIIVGSLLIIFGIADGVTSINRRSYGFWTGHVFFGVWIGAWMCVTGALGIPGSRYERNFSRNCFAGVFMGFSITSAVLGGIIIICYSIALAFAGHYYYYYYDSYGTYRRYPHYSYQYNTKMALSVIVLILGIVEFTMGIWAAVCLCVMKPCCSPAEGPTVVFAGNTTGQTVALGIGGGQVAFPAQTAGGVLPGQASYMYAQGMQATSAPMPLGALGGPPPPQLVVASAPVGADSPRETEMEAYGGKYKPLNEQL
ncbi:uncharacterized protein [Montipora capricornis]|uniref:uncharacterized protein n=1 Tax=Montipora capricornis TaxID=246305 RepID=UPI0035F1863C